MNHRDERSLWYLYLVAFIDLLSVSLFLPLLSKEIQVLGGDPVLIGVIGSIYGALQLFSSPVMGWGSDTYGQKKILFICLLATSVAYFLQGYASSLMLLLVARALAGCFKHTQTIAKSIISDLSQENKSNVLGNFNAFGSMGFIIGPTIGAHLVELEGGFRSVCILASVGFFVNIFILVLCVSAPKRKHISSFQAKIKGKDHEKDETKGAYLCLPSALSNGSASIDKYSLWGILFLRFVYSGATIVYRANLPLTFESKFGTSVIHVGYLNSAQALVSTLAGFAVGPVVARFYQDNAESMVKSAGMLKTVSLLALVIAPNFRLAGLSTLIQSAADPFIRVGITAMSLEGHDDPGTILGLGQTATALSRMLAPFAAGLSQTFSPSDGPAVVGTVTSFFAIVATYLVSRARGKKIQLHNKNHSNGNGSEEMSGLLVPKNKKVD